jgi:hypothetical protein
MLNAIGRKGTERVGELWQVQQCQLGAETQFVPKFWASSAEEICPLKTNTKPPQFGLKDNVGSGYKWLLSGFPAEHSQKRRSSLTNKKTNASGVREMEVLWLLCAREPQLLQSCQVPSGLDLFECYNCGASAWMLRGSLH